MTRELQLVDRMRRILEKNGATTMKTHGTGNIVGQPDIIACYKGRFIALEVKVPGKKPTELQFATLKRWTIAGAIAFWSDNPNNIMGVIESAIEEDKHDFSTLGKDPSLHL